jgi:cytochrome c551/c552
MLGPAALFLLWAGVAFSGEPVQGDREEGRRLFEKKGCVVCHAPPGQPKGIGPPLAELQRRQGLLELAGRLWNHAPAMQQLLAERGQAWPTFTAREMADLAAWLMARPGADRPGSETRGQALLVKKGCLKCHVFFGEGAGVGPDLSRYRHYGNPLDWATNVWNHAPKMRAKAEKIETGYPRFEAGEMVDLLKFLKASAGRNQPAH